MLFIIIIIKNSIKIDRGEVAIKSLNCILQAMIISQNFDQQYVKVARLAKSMI